MLRESARRPRGQAHLCCFSPTEFAGVNGRTVFRTVVLFKTKAWAAAEHYAFSNCKFSKRNESYGATRSEASSTRSYE